jgi:hypothetical protein
MSNVRWAGQYQAELVMEAWRRTGGEFDPVWSAPALTSTGQWHPGRRMARQVR